MQDLARIELVKQQGNCGIWYVRRSGGTLKLCRDMIAGAICFIPLKREGIDVTQYIGLHLSHRPQRFEVAGARCLEMHESPGFPCRDLVDAEFIRPRVQAQLIRPQGARNSCMDGKVCCEYGEITDVVHTLLEAPNVTRRETHQLNAQPAQLG